MERARNELLPYILDLMDDDEEILIEMAAKLDGDFLEYVGGSLFAPHLFKPLERLPSLTCLFIVTWLSVLRARAPTI